MKKKAVTLYDWAKNDEKATERTIESLADNWGIDKIGEAEGKIILRLPLVHRTEIDQMSSKDWVSIWDNGGEVKVWVINTNDVYAIPYSSKFGKNKVTAEAMAYRISCACYNMPIDYEYLDSCIGFGVEPMLIKC